MESSGRSMRQTTHSLKWTLHLTNTWPSIYFSRRPPLGDWGIGSFQERTTNQQAGKQVQTRPTPVSPNIKHTPTESKPKQMNINKKDPWFPLFWLRFLRPCMYSIYPPPAFPWEWLLKISTSPACSSFLQTRSEVMLGKVTLLQSNHLQFSF